MRRLTVFGIALCLCGTLWQFAPWGTAAEPTANPAGRPGARLFPRARQAAIPANGAQGALPISRVQEVGDPIARATELDRLLEASLQEQQVPLAPICNDETFLRRVSLDIVGTIPTSNDITLFGLDTDPDKRARTIDALLESPEYGKNWGSFYREVIFSRATEERARITQQKFEDWLAGEWQKNRPWNEITTEILTATGSSSDDGRTAFMVAHTGVPEELAGETARIFLGVQLQCANCHDHPYDAWKREQFHELAAYFPRVQVRRDNMTQPPTFNVTSADYLERIEQNRNRPEPEQMFRLMDTNRDGQLTRAETQRRPEQKDRFERLFENGDTNADGKISLDEFKQAAQRIAEQGNRRTAEHYMADLEHPSEKGTKMQPVFFLTGDKVPYGTDDLDRRRILANEITAPSNPWFSKAFVNRVWSEMLGEGFFPTVDDMGPLREAAHSEVLEELSQQFTQSGYDIKGLIRTIANTRAYQRALGSRQVGDTTPKFAAAVTTRLRSDQIYNVTKQALGVTGFANGSGRSRTPGGGGDRYLQTMDPGRVAFFRLFNYDPSTPQDEVLGNIPQALFLMNSPLLQTLAGANGPRTMLGRLLQAQAADEDALSELYLRTLSREPSSAEEKLCIEYIASSKSRVDGYEDIFWSLLNSSEFLTKH